MTKLLIMTRYEIMTRFQNHLVSTGRVTANRQPTIMNPIAPCTLVSQTNIVRITHFTVASNTLFFFTATRFVAAFETV